jgi:transcription antitermination factor NusA-like protein
MKMRVYLVEDHPNFKEFVESLLYPIPIETINIVWLPGGIKETRIVLGKRIDRRREELVKKIIKVLRGVDVKVGYLR